MPSQPNFTRTPIAPAATPSLLNPGVPLPVGKVMLTPDTRTQMEAMGWKDGDPIPTNLAQKVAQVQAQYQQELETAQLNLPPDHKPPRIKLVDISTLPPAAQAELRDFMAEARQLAAEDRAQAEATAHADASIPAGAHPSVAAAIRASQQAAQLAQAGPSATVAPMRAPPAPSVTPVAGPNFTAAPAPTHALPVRQAAPEVIPEVVPPAEEVVAGGKTAPTTCPRCQWDMGLEFESEPTALDREDFVGAVLAQSRFRKTISVLGDRLKITFRSLTAKEAELLFSQLRADVRNDVVVTDADYFTKLQVYRLVMGLEKITANDQIVTQIPEIFTVPYDPLQPGAKSLLEQMTEWFWDEAVPQETMRRLVALHQRSFQRLVETLEAQTIEPDFWTGIGQRA